ncbi:hypothetical protein HG263_10775 [Pseudoalteromonas sp. JBTF-M23]|uniref:GHMP kinase C-terminal domain-containing protein n=1 Tax=Pseudoalteromonas caenipelagi TaxID=2726988 RepID=A0A849VCJ5_9GAMM|nr:hypothetical protein [Pseudoalteromonas caenipelagi]NOU51016.1 hypothetical protein [Pseudoalteromonas caenipelagi]
MSEQVQRFFNPGEQLNIHQSWSREASPQYESAEVWIPGRLHFGVLNFSHMSPGLGGGGVGISTDTVGYKVKISKNEPENRCDIASGRHLIELFCQCVNYKGNDIHIELEKLIEHKHSGFGSNVSFNTAVIAGLNAFFGSPYSVQEVWDIVTQNYIENASTNGKLYFGLDTGVGEACFLYGGIVWIQADATNSRFVTNVPTDNLWVVTTVGNRANLNGELLESYGQGAALSEDVETQLVAEHFMACEQKYGQKLRKFMHQDFFPALLSQDLDTVLELGWEMNKFSNIKVLEGIYKSEVLQNLNSCLLQHGASYAGMSSAGPGYFALADSKEKALELAELIEKEFSPYFSDVCVGRAGKKLSITLK